MSLLQELVTKETQVFRASKVSKELRAHKEPLVLKAPKELRERKELKEPLVLRVSKASKVFKVTVIKKQKQVSLPQQVKHHSL